MMILYLIAPNGRFVQELRGTAEEVLPQIPEGYETTTLIPPRNSDYWNGTSWVNIGPAPAWYMQFDYDTKQWKDTRSLEQTKAQKWEKIKLERNTLELSGFEYGGNIYDSDIISQTRIIGAVVRGGPTTWTLKNNNIVELTAAEVHELGQALATHIQSVHERGLIARQNIELSTTVDQVDAVRF